MRETRAKCVRLGVGEAGLNLICYHKMRFQSSKISKSALAAGAQPRTL